MSTLINQKLCKAGLILSQIQFLSLIDLAITECLLCARHWRDKTRMPLFSWSLRFCGKRQSTKSIKIVWLLFGNQKLSSFAQLLDYAHTFCGIGIQTGIVRVACLCPRLAGGWNHGRGIFIYRSGYWRWVPARTANQSISTEPPLVAWASPQHGGLVVAGFWQGDSAPKANVWGSRSGAGGNYLAFSDAAEEVTLVRSKLQDCPDWRSV